MARYVAGTVAILKQHRMTVFDPTVHHKNGRVVRMMGDGASVDFPSGEDR